MGGFRRAVRRAAYLSVPTAAAIGLTYYASPTFRDIVHQAAFPGSRTIDVPVRVRGPDGKAMRTNKKFPRLTDDAIEMRLKENALGQTTLRSNGLGAWRYQTAFLAANDGIEDAHAQALVERDLTPLAPPGDLLFFAIMDGHAGAHTSRLLSKALIPAVAAEMSALITSTRSLPPKTTSTLSYIKSFFVSGSGKSKDYEFDKDPTYVSAALRTAFSKLDSKIINAPINLLDHIESQKDETTKPHEHPLAKATLEPAMSGSCALLAMLDTSRRDMYVACTGDSRAVAGYWDQPRDGSPGYWRAEVLSEDQTGRNPNELKRMQSEHPADEADLVIQRGRVLGGLEPTRAFGDARYKWPREVGERLVQNLLPAGSTVRRVPNDLKTPPYVVADPVVTHRKLDFLPEHSSSTSPTVPPTASNSDVESTLKFVVLATDGLWDELSSKDVVGLVGGHLSGLRGDAITKSVIPVQETDTAKGVEGKTAIQRLQESNASSAVPETKWAFVDSHVGTHLIRNALGGADKEKLAWRVSLPPGVARRFRDDITVTVVWYEDGKPVLPDTSADAGEKVDGAPFKAKL
ncbi:protein serine/threonine phosphatase 2C [Clavulina sp. PMI_390]|nr:protein serine/threonine phosphatase 2C [Clavulina sp. PMI_390]